jgi:hypothetical protein
MKHKGNTTEVVHFKNPVYINGPSPVMYISVQLDIWKTVPKYSICKTNAQGNSDTKWARTTEISGKNKLWRKEN